MIQARVDKKDPEAIYFLGQHYFYGVRGLQKNTRRAVELWEEAAELGSIRALHNLALSYLRGEGVEQDMAVWIHFYKKAAMQGCALSRHNLGGTEAEKGNYDRAVNHLLISAKMGHDPSVEIIRRIFMDGHATKEQYAEALRGYQDTVEEMKSHDRDEAKRLGF